MLLAKTATTLLYFIESVEQMFVLTFVVVENYTCLTFYFLLCHEKKA